MSHFYTQAHRELQDAHDTRRMADLMEGAIAQPVLSDNDRAYISSLDLFFLATVDHHGDPTVSYKGGAPGFVRCIDERTIVFPAYDGNGMFLSMGNVAATKRVGMLFIDFETPNRLRVQGSASIVRDHPLKAEYPGALFLVQVAVERVWINCARYVHKRVKVQDSKYVPKADCEAPIPSWKRIDLVQDALPARDQGKAESEGGLITMEQYGEKLMRGES
jgi:uncharacterized protein